MKRILVTGGAGFIGSHIVEGLLESSEEYEVFVLDDFSTGSMNNLAGLVSDKLKIITCDIASSKAREIVISINPDAMLLLAAQPSVKVSFENPLLDVKSNLLGLVNLLEAARYCSCRRVVFASSGGTIYADVAPEKLPIIEDQPLKACSFYGLSKLTAILYLELYKNMFSIEYVALALGNVYGPRQDSKGESGVIAIFSNKVLDEIPCVVNGDGKTTRDYVFVKDVVDAFIQSIDKGSGLINIGSGIETSVLEIKEKINDVSNKNSPTIFGPPLPGEVRRVSLNPTRAKKELNWHASTSLEQGIRSVVAWMKEEKYKEQDQTNELSNRK